MSQDRTITVSHNFHAADLQATSPNSPTFVTSEFLRAELLKVLVWNVPPHRLVDGVKGTRCLHIQGQAVQEDLRPVNNHRRFEGT